MIRTEAIAASGPCNNRKTQVLHSPHRSGLPGFPSICYSTPELAKDENPDVRTAVVKTLASFSRAEDRPLLRELAKDKNLDVRIAAVKALASFSSREEVCRCWANWLWRPTTTSPQRLFAA